MISRYAEDFNDTGCCSRLNVKVCRPACLIHFTMLISLQTARIVLPVKKFLLPGEHISQPIPTLSDRQFVVTKSNLTSAEETNQRELFWYREELFKFIRGHWREVRGSSVFVVHPSQMQPAGRRYSFRKPLSSTTENDSTNVRDYTN